MSTAGQPWMLQRAKWSKVVAMPVTGNDQPRHHNKNERDDTPSSILRYWVSTHPSAEFTRWSSLEGDQSADTSAFEDSNQDTLVYHSGVLSEQSGWVKAIARTYFNDRNDGSKKLKSVSFLDGFMHAAE